MRDTANHYSQRIGGSVEDSDVPPRVVRMDMQMIDTQQHLLVFDLIELSITNENGT
jgi:hypothetical protein